MNSTMAPAPQTAPAAVSAALATVPAQEGTLSVYSNERAFATGQRIAKSLAESSLVPEAYRGNIANCMIALELAGRIGASVFMVMQNLDVIHGRPGLRSTFLIATVNTSGRFTPLRFRWEGTPGSDGWGCRAYARGKGDGEECVGTLITIGLAKAEGWYGRNGSKWKTIPEQMLQYRAASFWTRVYCPELSLGMQTSDEVIDTVGYEVPNAGPDHLLIPQAPPQAAPPRDWDAEAAALKARVDAAGKDDIAAVREAIKEYLDAGAPKPLVDALKREWSAASKAIKDVTRQAPAPQQAAAGQPPLADAQGGQQGGAAGERGDAYEGDDAP